MFEMKSSVINKELIAKSDINISTKIKILNERAIIKLFRKKIETNRLSDFKISMNLFLKFLLSSSNLS